LVLYRYIEQTQFSDYICNLDTEKAKDTSLGSWKKTYDQIERLLIASMIFSEWETTVHNFEQWVFPFGVDFKTNFPTRRIRDYMAPSINTTAALLELLIPDVKTWISDLRLEINKYSSAVFPSVDGELVKTDFNSQHSTSIPFHVFNWEDNPRAVHDLLSGEKVTFSIYPDFTYNHDMAAVKFTIAEFVPKLRDRKFQKQLDQLLTNVRVEMVHSGLSRYYYDDETFDMFGSRLSIQYNFERNSAGQRLGRNKVYEEIQQGSVILSPYTI